MGFSEPIAVWLHKGKSFILNGHQRVAVLRALASEGYTIPPLPVSIVDAESYQQAKKKVLALTSQVRRDHARGPRGSRRLLQFPRPRSR